MKNRMIMLVFAIMAMSMFNTPVMAAPPEGEPAATTGSPSEVAKPEEAATSGESSEAKSEETGTGGDTTGGAASEDATTGGDTTGGAASDEAQPAEIKSDEEAVSILKQAISAAKDGHWSLMIAFSIMLLVYLVKRFGLKDKLSSDMLPLVASGLSMASYVAAALMVEGVAMQDAILGGVTTGAAAVGLWEILFKHFLGRKAGAASSEASSEASSSES